MIWGFCVVFVVAIISCHTSYAKAKSSTINPTGCSRNIKTCENHPQHLLFKEKSLNLCQFLFISLLIEKSILK